MSNWYCPLPFKSVYSENNGVKPCCSYASRFTGTIPEWLASNELAELQRKFLNNEVDDNCRFCAMQEKNGVPSTRQKGLRDHTENPTVTNITELDYRSNNLCNYKCRSCYAGASSAWVADVKQSKLLQSYQTIPDTKLLYNNNSNSDWLLDNLEQFDYITLAGGEPTLIDEVKELVSKLADLPERDRRIVIITNGSIFDNFWEDVTRKLGYYLVWCISLDAIGKEAEIIRHGTKWDQVDQNIQRIVDTGYAVTFNTTVSNLNLRHLGPLQEYVGNIRKQKHARNHPCIQTVKAVWMPNFMNPVNWPADQLDNVLASLDNTIANEQFDDARSWLQGIRDQIVKNKFDPVLWEKHLAFNRELDHIRSEDSSIL